MGQGRPWPWAWGSGVIPAWRSEVTVSSILGGRRDTNVVLEGPNSSDGRVLVRARIHFCEHTFRDMSLSTLTS